MRSTNPKLDLFRDEWCGREIDQIWREWVDIYGPSDDQLVELVSDPEIADAYKARAFHILLSLWFKDLSIYWKYGGTDHGPLYYQNIQLPDLSEEMLQYLCGLASVLERELIGEKDKDAQGKGLTHLNMYILQLMERLPIESAARLWSLYHLNDPSLADGFDHRSGYQPWYRLMRSRKVDSHWKLEADKMMHQRIQEELSGEAHPRRSWESALGCYTWRLNLLLSEAGSDKASEYWYSVGLLRQQFEFLLTLSPETLREARAVLVGPGNISRLLTLLGNYDEGSRGLRQRIVEFVCMDRFHQFDIYSEREYQIAKCMLLTLPENHPLAKDLAERMHEARIRLDGMAAELKKSKEEQLEAWNKMKK